MQKKSSPHFDVLKKIQLYWPDEDPDKIISLLNEYGKEEMERGGSRVHLAILKLCERNLEHIPRFVQIAKKDYRDVIAYAEYPEQMQIGFLKMREMTPAQRKAVKERDAKQYIKWLNNNS